VLTTPPRRRGGYGYAAQYGYGEPAEDLAVPESAPPRMPSARR
jgi:hypothetical protein